jgi:hypothetical protein
MQNNECIKEKIGEWWKKFGENECMDEWLYECII